jgi:hypothetical protein
MLREVPYLRSVALLVLAGATTQSILDYLLSSAAVASLGTGPRLLSFFALFQTAVGVLSFLLQVGVSRGLLERYGVGAVLAVSPSLVLGGAAAALAAPPLAAAVLLRGGDGVLGASLHRSAYEVLFAPVEPGRRRASKPLLDVGFDRAGMLLGSGAVALVLAVAPASARVVLLAAVAALALLRLLLSPRLQAGYRGSLAENLRGGRLWRSGVGVLDRGTVGALSRLAARPPAEVLREVARSAPAPDGDGARLSIAAFDLPVCPECGPEAGADDDVLATLGELRSGDEARLRAVLRRRRTEPLLVPQVVALLGDDRAARDAADWLCAQEPLPIGALADALLAERLADPARRRIARLLGKMDDPRAAQGLLAALPVVPTAVRPAVAEALARVAARRPLPRDPLLVALRRVAAEPTRGEAALEEIFSLLSAAYPREPVARAREALERGGDARGTALEWLDVVLPGEVKAALWPRIARTGERVTSRPRSADELRSALRSGVFDRGLEGDA